MNRVLWALIAVISMAVLIGCTALFDDLDQYTPTVDDDAGHTGDVDADDVDANDADADDGGTTCAGCEIEGQCFEEDEISPDNTCLACNTSQDDSRWSNRPDGSECGEQRSCQNGRCLCDPGFTGEDCDICTVYVRPEDEDEDSNDLDGLTWQSALTDLQVAIDLAAFEASNPLTPHCEVWVQSGTYFTPGDGPDGAFELDSNIRLYGGFEGNETLLSQRDLDSNETILDGQESDRVLYQPRDIEEIRIDGFTIANGHARSGAGLDIDRGGNGIYANLEFRDNVAHFTLGGGLRVNAANSHYTFEDILFRDNQANNRGGGASFTTNGNSTVHIADSRFEENSSRRGGGLAISGPVQDFILDNVEFHNNEAHLGGALYLTETESVEILNSEFLDNSALSESGQDVGHGGAIFATDSSFEVRHSRFEENSADSRGGAINIEFEESTDAATMTALNSIFTDNHANQRGGVLQIVNTSVTIINGLLNDNSSGSIGGAINCATDCSLSLLNNTVINNTATNGNAIRAHNTSQIQLVNTIIWGTDHGQLVNVDLHEDAWDFNIIRSEEIPPDENNPQLAGTTYEPSASSPAVDAGVDPTDFDTFNPLPFLTDEEGDPIDLWGNPRIVGDAIDIGAVERQDSE